MNARLRLLVCALAIVSLCTTLRISFAQGADSPSGPEFFFSPYLWISGTHATTKTPLPQAPEVNSNVSFIDTLSELKGVPVIGAAEIHGGSFSLVGDIIRLPLGTDITTRNVFFQGGSARMSTTTGTALVLYRVLEDPSQFADLGAGFRSWGFSMKLNLNAGLLPATSVTSSAGWGDPLIAGRYHFDFGNGWGLSAYGDIGGFSVGARLDWQLLGTIDYLFKPWLNLRLGYRSLNFNYQQSDSNVGFNVHLRGPILAGVFRF